MVNVRRGGKRYNAKVVGDATMGRYSRDTRL